MDAWDDLRFFLAVQRGGTLTAAARALGCSQPTVGRRVAALARRHGAALFELRDGRHLLTAVGRRVLARVERIEREVDGIGREVDRFDERPAGAVRIAAPEGLAVARIAPRLAEFRQRYPAIDLVLAGEHTVVDLVRGEADLAVRFARPRQHSLVVRRLATVSFWPVAAPSYLARRPRPGHALLDDEDVITLPEEQVGSRELAWLRRHIPAARLSVRLQTPLGVRAAVLAGVGAGLLAPYLTDDKSLRRLTGPPPLVRELVLVYHRALRRTARLQIATRFVTECLEGL